MSIHLKTIKEGDLGELTIIVGDPGRVLLIAEAFDSYKELLNSREFLLVNGFYKGVKASICSTGMGVGSTEICVSELIENGAKKIVRCGGCGAWMDGINTGDIIVNNAMARTNGLMSTYVPDTYPAVADPFLVNKITDQLKRENFKVHVGIGITSETYYIGQGRNNNVLSSRIKVPQMVDEWTQYNVMNCEMETAVLFILGSLFQIPVANCLAVHVSRKNDKWEDEDAYRKLHYKMAVSVLDALID